MSQGDSTPGPYGWSESIRRMLEANEEIRRQHVAMQSMAKMLADTDSFRKAAASVEASRKAIDPGSYLEAIRWAARHRKIMDNMAQMLQRSHPPIERHLRELIAYYPVSDTTSAPVVLPLEETLTALEAAQEEYGDESELEQFFSEDTNIDADVTGLAALLDIENPVVQERVRKVVKWLLTLLVLALLVGDSVTFGILSNLLSMMGVSIKDSDKAADSVMQKIIRQRQDHEPFDDSDDDTL